MLTIDPRLVEPRNASSPLNQSIVYAERVPELDLKNPPTIIQFNNCPLVLIDAGERLNCGPLYRGNHGFELWIANI